MSRLPLRSALRPLSDLELAVGMAGCLLSLYLLGPEPDHGPGLRPAPHAQAATAGGAERPVAPINPRVEITP